MAAPPPTADACVAATWRTDSGSTLHRAAQLQQQQLLQQQPLQQPQQPLQQQLLQQPQEPLSQQQLQQPQQLLPQQPLPQPQQILPQQQLQQPQQPVSQHQPMARLPGSQESLPQMQQQLFQLQQQQQQLNGMQAPGPLPGLGRGDSMPLTAATGAALPVAGSQQATNSRQLLIAKQQQQQQLLAHQGLLQHLQLQQQQKQQLQQPQNVGMLKAPQMLPQQQQLRQQQAQQHQLQQQQLQQQQLMLLRSPDSPGLYSAFCRLLHQVSLHRLSLRDARVRVLLVVLRWLQQQQQQQHADPSHLFREGQFERLVQQTRAYMQLLLQQQPLKQEELLQLGLSPAVGFKPDREFLAAVAAAAGGGMAYKPVVSKQQQQQQQRPRSHQLFVQLYEQQLQEQQQKAVSLLEQQAQKFDELARLRLEQEEEEQQHPEQQQQQPDLPGHLQVEKAQAQRQQQVATAGPPPASEQSGDSAALGKQEEKVKGGAELSGDLAEAHGKQQQQEMSMEVDRPEAAGSKAEPKEAAAAAAATSAAASEEESEGEGISSSEELWGVGDLHRPADDGTSSCMQERARISRLQRRLLCLAPLQRQVREEVLAQRLMETSQQLPPLQHLPVRLARKHRALRMLRERGDRLTAARQQQQQQRQQVLQQLLDSHRRAFLQQQRDVLRQLRRVAAAVKRKKAAAGEGADGSTSCGHPLHPTDCGCPGAAAVAAQMRKERLDALRKHDEAAYLKLLQETKNERLLQLVRQTEGYMQQIGSLVVEQREREGIIVPATEEEADGAAEEASGSLSSSFLFSKERYYRITHSQREKVTELPSCLKGGTLRSYQMEGLNWLVSLHNNGLNGILVSCAGAPSALFACQSCLCFAKEYAADVGGLVGFSSLFLQADCMGLGKTVQTVSFLAYLYEKKGVRNPHLILAPLSTLHGNWRLEFKKWWPSLRIVVYEGAKDVRKALRSRIVSGVRVEGSGQEMQRFFEPNFDVLLTTDAFVLRDKSFLKKIQWEYLIVDEAHRLKNPNSKLVQTLNSGFSIKRRIALTGTPLQNDIVEVWALLNFLMPSIFNAKLNFEQWLNVPLGAAAGGGSGAAGEDQPHAIAVTEEEKLLIIDRLHKVLRPFLLRREKAEVADELPSKQEEIVWCPLSGVQRILYRLIEESPMGHNRMVQLRKVCNHPFLFCFSTFTPDESLVRCCGKFAMLDVLLPALKAAQHRVLVFSQMTKLLDLLEAYLSLRGYRYLRLDGGTSSEERQTRLALYNQENSPYFLFILSTKAGGLGVNLQSADTVIIFDSDWNPQNDEQAQSRAHRIGQKREVLTIRFVTPSSVEEQILHSAELKLDKDALVIKSGMYNGELQDRETERQEQVREILRRRKQLEANLTRPFDFAILKNQLSRNPAESRIFDALQRIRQLLHLPGLIYGEAVPPCLFRWSKTVERSQMDLVENTAQAAQDWKWGYSLSDYWSIQRKKKIPSISSMKLQLVGGSSMPQSSAAVGTSAGGAATDAKQQSGSSTTTANRQQRMQQQPHDFLQQGMLQQAQRQEPPLQQLMQQQAMAAHPVQAQPPEQQQQDQVLREGQQLLQQQQQALQQQQQLVPAQELSGPDAPSGGASTNALAPSLVKAGDAATDAAGAAATAAATAAAATDPIAATSEAPAPMAGGETGAAPSADPVECSDASASAGLDTAATSGPQAAAVQAAAATEAAATAGGAVPAAAAALAAPAASTAAVEPVPAEAAAASLSESAAPSALPTEANAAACADASPATSSVLRISSVESEPSTAEASGAAAAPGAPASLDAATLPAPAAAANPSTTAVADGSAAASVDAAAAQSAPLAVASLPAAADLGGAAATPVASGAPEPTAAADGPSPVAADDRISSCGTSPAGGSAAASVVAAPTAAAPTTAAAGSGSAAIGSSKAEPGGAEKTDLWGCGEGNEGESAGAAEVCLANPQRWKAMLNAAIFQALTEAIKDQRFSAFVELPSPAIYKDYYERVTKPVCLLQIRKFADKQEFTSLSKLEKYLTRLAENARAYNGQESPLFLRALECIGAVLLKSRVNACIAFHSLHSHAQGEKIRRLFEVYRSCWDSTADTPLPDGESAGQGDGLGGELIEAEGEADDDDASNVSSQLSSTVRSGGSYSRSATSSLLPSRRGAGSHSYYDDYSAFPPSMPQPDAAAAWQQQQLQQPLGGASSGTSARKKALVRLPAKPPSAAAGPGRPAATSKKQAYTPSYLGYVPQGIELPLPDAGRAGASPSSPHQDDQMHPLLPGKKQRRAAAQEVQQATAAAPGGVSSYPYASGSPFATRHAGIAMQQPQQQQLLLQMPAGANLGADSSAGYTNLQQQPYGNVPMGLPPASAPFQQQFGGVVPPSGVSVGGSHERKAKRDRKAKAAKSKKRAREGSLQPQQLQEPAAVGALPLAGDTGAQRPIGMKPLRIRLSFGAQQQAAAGAVSSQPLPPLYQQTQPAQAYAGPHDLQHQEPQQPVYSQPAFTPLQQPAPEQPQPQQPAASAPPKFRIRLPMQPPQ
ncbi:hypothetical protein Emed_001512 [Eimeria media]